MIDTGSCPEDVLDVVDIVAAANVVVVVSSTVDITVEISVVIDTGSCPVDVVDVVETLGAGNIVAVDIKVGISDVIVVVSATVDINVGLSVVIDTGSCPEDVVDVDVAVVDSVVVAKIVIVVS